MAAHRMLHGRDFHSGAFYERQKRHHRIICATCVDTLVTPSELAATIDSDGNVDAYAAAALVKALIGRAHDTAVGQTLGILSRPTDREGGDVVR